MDLQYYISSEEASFFINNKMGSSDRIPTSGEYKVGDFIVSNTQENGIFGWVCTVAGIPGTWVEIVIGNSGGIPLDPELIAKINSIGDVTQLQTSNKTNIVNAINELFQSASDGKSKIATAITGKGVNASSSDSFQVLSDKISQIKTGFELPMTTPTYEIGIGTVTAICNTQNNLFTKFKLNSNGSWQSSNRFDSLSPVTSYTFYGQTSDGYTASISVSTPKANQKVPALPASSNITSNSITITAATGCKISYNNRLYNSPYTFTGLTPNTNYLFYSVKEATTSLNQSISNALTVKTLTDIPGNSTIIKGNSTSGLYDLNVTGIIRGSDLISITGLTEGIPEGTMGDITFAKCSYNDKIVFFPLDFSVDSITWDNLNILGLTGTGKQITMSGKIYSVRVIDQNNFDTGEYSDVFYPYVMDSYSLDGLWGQENSRSSTGRHAILCGDYPYINEVTSVSKGFNRRFAPILVYEGSVN